MGNWINSELEILKRVVSCKRTLANTIQFTLSCAFPHPEHYFAQDVFVSINLPRTELKLLPDKKPGDIDLLIIPFKEEQVLVDRAIAIEAKVLRPTIKNTAKNCNTMGVTQATGLLSDGFPYVGLLHISIPEQSPAKECLSMPINSEANGMFAETGEYYLADLFPMRSAGRQEGRLRKLVLPEEISYSAIAMILSEDREDIIGNTIGNSRKGFRNPKVSLELIDNIGELLDSKPELFAKIYWYDRF